MIPYGTKRSGKFAQGLCVCLISSRDLSETRTTAETLTLLPGKSAEDLEGMDCSTITRIIQKSGKERQLRYVGTDNVRRGNGWTEGEGIDRLWES